MSMLDVLHQPLVGPKTALKPPAKPAAKAKDKSAREISNGELLVILEQNAFLIEENYRLTKRLYAHMVFSQVMFWVKFLLVVASVALALNYLPPFMGSVTSLYQKAMQTETQLKLR